MHCTALATGERYNIYGIHNYLSDISSKYTTTFMPEGKDKNEL